MSEQDTKSLKQPEKQYLLESGYKDLTRDQTDEELSEELGMAALDRKQEDTEFGAETDIQMNKVNQANEKLGQAVQDTEFADKDFANGAYDTEYSAELYGGMEDAEFGTDLGSAKASKTPSVVKEKNAGTDLTTPGTDTEFGSIQGDTEFSTSFGSTTDSTKARATTNSTQQKDTEIAADFGRTEEDTEFAAEAMPQAGRSVTKNNEDEESGGASSIGIFGFILSIASLFIYPAILGPVGAVMGFVAYSRGSRGLGISAIAIGALSFIVYMLLRMAYD